MIFLFEHYIENIYYLLNTLAFVNKITQIFYLYTMDDLIFKQKKKPCGTIFTIYIIIIYLYIKNNKKCKIKNDKMARIKENGMNLMFYINLYMFFVFEETAGCKSKNIYFQLVESV